MLLGCRGTQRAQRVAIGHAAAVVGGANAAAGGVEPDVTAHGSVVLTEFSEVGFEFSAFFLFGLDSTR